METCETCNFREICDGFADPRQPACVYWEKKNPACIFKRDEKAEAEARERKARQFDAHYNLADWNRRYLRWKAKKEKKK